MEEDVEITEDGEGIKAVFKDNIRQGVLRRLARAYSDQIGRGYFLIYETTMMLLAKMGHEPLRKAWGNQYKTKYSNLKKLGVLLADLNFLLLDKSEKQLLKERFVIDPQFIYYRDLFCKASLYLEVLYSAFYVLLESTPILKHQDIPNDYWAIVEKLEAEE